MMTGDRKIVGLWPAETGQPEPTIATAAPTQSAAPVTTEVAPDGPVIDHGWTDPDPSDAADGALAADRSLRWLAGLALALLAIWSAAQLWMLWTQTPTLSGVGLAVALIIALAPPLVAALIVGVVVRRLSPRATHGQIRLVRQLQAEQLAAEARLAAMHEQWRLADAELQRRAEAMGHYGLDTVARLAEAGARIEATMQQCSTAASALAERGEQAQRQLDSLSLAMPRVEEVAARLADNLRQAGQSAYQFGGQLEARIASLNVEAATAGAALTEAGDALGERVAALHAASEGTRTTLLAGIEQLDAAAQQQRDRALILLSEYAASANETTIQSAADISEAQARLRQQISDGLVELRGEVETLQATALRLHGVADAAVERSQAAGSALASDLDTTEARLAAVDAQFSSRLAALGNALALLTGGVTAFTEKAEQGDSRATALIQRAETLLIALDSAAREIDETVPGALDRLGGHAARAGAMIEALAPLAETEAGRVADIEERLSALAAHVAAQQQQVDALNAADAAILKARQDGLGAIEQAVAALQARLDALAQGDGAAVIARLRHIEEEASNSLDRTEQALAQLVDAASVRAAQQLGAAIDQAAGTGVNERLSAMSAHADQAVAAAAAASDRLMRQLITIADSSAALEARAQEVAALSAKVETETLARQMAMLTEALQSTAVDLTRILDLDVADQAWEAYLKGDRGIFTRRAARLLSGTEAREILRRYEGDEGFRVQVNRYIHDFEAMLRGVMDTRDGQALSVTLLSSDMGKLYVALAQAIERLRR